MSISFVVYGAPAAQGSKRHVGKGIMIESSKKVAPWREDVKHAALAALDGSTSWDRAATHVGLVVTFFLPRPRSHFGTGIDTKHMLRDAAPLWPGTRPDLDKLLRSTCDALTSSGIYADDSRVVAVRAFKQYRQTSGAMIELFDMRVEDVDRIEQRP